MASKRALLPSLGDDAERMHFQPLVTPAVAAWIKAEAKAHRVSASVIVSHLIAAGHGCTEWWRANEAQPVDHQEPLPGLIDTAVRDA